jgi:hypothetical protein
MVVEGVQNQGADEKITYQVTTTNWASSPTSESMVVKDSDGTEVAVTSGSMSVAGDVITLKAISGLTAGERYKVEVKFTAGSGAPFECYFYIDCEE